MSKEYINQQVYEQYVDATVALFMEHYAAALTDATMQTESTVRSCSEALDRRCMEMIRKECAKQRRKEFWKGTKKVLRSAAVILIAMLSLSSVLFMTVEAFRIPVINFFIEQGDGFWAITGRSEEAPVDPATADAFDPNDPLAGLLPEGYKLESTKGSTRDTNRYLYLNSNGNRVLFSMFSNGAFITIDSENAEVSENGLVAGCKYVFVLKNDLVQIAWIDEQTDISYILSTDTMDKESLLLIAEELMKKMSK